MIFLNQAINFWITGIADKLVSVRDGLLRIGNRGSFFWLLSGVKVISCAGNKKRKTSSCRSNAGIQFFVGAFFRNFHFFIYHFFYFCRVQRIRNRNGIRFFAPMFFEFFFKIFIAHNWPPYVYKSAFFSRSFASARLLMERMEPSRFFRMPAISLLV